MNCNPVWSVFSLCKMLVYILAPFVYPGAEVCRLGGAFTPVVAWWFRAGQEGFQTNLFGSGIDSLCHCWVSHGAPCSLSKQALWVELCLSKRYVDVPTLGTCERDLIRK